MGDLIRENVFIVGLLVGSVPLLLGLASWLGFREWSIRHRFRGILDVDGETAKRRRALQKLTKHYTAKRQIYDELRKAVAAFEETLDAAEHGLYSPHFEFDTSEGYRAKLQETRSAQKKMIKDKTAAHSATDWSVGGSRREGAKMMSRYIKLILRAFNGECDAMMDKMRWNNAQTLEQRMGKIFDSINKLGETQHVSISPGYYDLKISELRLAHEYAQKRQDEKEEQRALREQMREEERAQRELRAAENKALDEERRYQKALDRARQELERKSGEDTADMQMKLARLEELLAEAKEKKERAISRAQMTKAGHVYVLSNLGSFGEGTYKIGMTRRLDPQERVKELGDASVPFSFDVHALIYSDNAPALEKQLHREFDQRRRNGVNNRKEFFDVNLEEIESVVEKLHGKIEFTKYAEAREFRETISLRAESVAGGAIDQFRAGEFPLEI